MKELRGFLLLLIICSSGLSSCKKDTFIRDSSARLEFSTDVVLFDTVFTDVGSTTQRFKVYNRHRKSLEIERISLSGGNSSPYRINIDGAPVSTLQDHIVAPKDSFYIFVEVTIDPNNESLPFVVQDSIKFITNENVQYVNLKSFGQNANRHVEQRITRDTTWTDNLPHLVYDYVIVDSNVTLTIDKNAYIHNHGGALIAVFGSIEIRGTVDEKVILEGDRLESYYEDVPGQWSGIRLFPSSSQNFIDHAIIRNAVTGVEVDSLSEPGMAPKLHIQNTTIENMSGVGIAAFTAEITGLNLLIDNCCQALFYAPFGGYYNFVHSTFAGTSCPCPQAQPSVIIQNQDFEDASGNITSFDLNFTVINSIIWGNQEDEIFLSDIKQTDTLSFAFNLLKSSIKALENGDNIMNEDPGFLNPCNYEFEPGENSPALNAGLPHGNLPLEIQLVIENDLAGNPRDPAEPDIGALNMPE